MTAAPAAAPAPTHPQPAPPPGAWRQWIRRHRTWTLLGLVFLGGLVLTAVLQSQPRGDAEALSTRNASPAGARAAAEILGRHGVAVEQAGSFEATRQALGTVGTGNGNGTTVLLYDPNGFLGPDQLKFLARAADRLVVVTPGLNTLRDLGHGIRPAGVVPGTSAVLPPDCVAEDAAAAGDIATQQGFLYNGPVVCYPAEGGTPGLYASTADGRLLVLGSTGIISNAELADKGNAALVLRSLGSQSRLIWYLPGLADVPASDQPVSLDQLAAPWVAYLGPWLALVAVLAMFWRGRRLGPLVVEPLPVVVKAAETAEGRARLYQDARAVDRAAGILRSGTLVRLARTLRLGPDAEAGAVIEAAARHLDRDPEQLALVLNARPRAEAGLVHWGQQLDRLEKEVQAR